MDPIISALVMGIVQGLTEFLPISSSGHLILVPYVLGWDDAFITSLAFSVALHAGTLGALLVYFREDWLRLVPAGLAALRDRSFRGDTDRRLAWLIVLATIPGAVAGVVLNDPIDSLFHPKTGTPAVGAVAIMLVAGAVILWLAERWGSRTRDLDHLSTGGAFGVGLAQALALLPGVSRSGISISASLFAGLGRADAARFSFLLATPITALAVAYEGYKLLKGEAGVAVEAAPLVVGVVASFVFGVLAIAGLLRYLRSRSFNIFVVYRVVLAVVVLAVFLTR
jgi:undecaprenyl-diphosphatase